MKYEEKLRIVPVWEKAMLTVDEAVAYSGIGRDKLIELAERESSLILGWAVSVFLSVKSSMRSLKTYIRFREVHDGKNNKKERPV